MTQKILSFVVPAYNVEPYIETCLDSFLCDEVLDQIEVIVVNDGSSDRTAEIVEGYVKKWPEVFRLYSQENGGHGAALNAGAALVSGKYLKAIDSDDWVITENLPEFVRKLQSCKADVVLTPYHQIDMETGEKSVWKMFVPEYDRCYTFEEIMNDWKAFDRCLTFHGISYRTEFYREYPYRLPGKIFYEDHEFAAIPCVHAGSICPMDLFLYQYRVGNPQQSVSADNRLKRIGHVEQVTLDLLRYGKAHPELSGSARGFLMKKAEGVALSYYITGCILDPDKRHGRRLCKEFNQKLSDIDQGFCKKLEKKYAAYLVMSLFHVNEKRYQQVMQSSIYRKIRHNHTIGQEK